MAQAGLLERMREAARRQRRAGTGATREVARSASETWSRWLGDLLADALRRSDTWQELRSAVDRLESQQREIISQLSQPGAEAAAAGRRGARSGTRTKPPASAGTASPAPGSGEATTGGSKAAGASEAPTGEATEARPRRDRPLRARKR